MKRAFRLLDDLFKDPAYVVTLALSTLLAYIWYLHASGDLGQRANRLPLLVLFTLFLLFGYIYSLRVRTENITLRRIAQDFFDINQIYRRSLSDRFLASPDPAADLTQLLVKEEATLRAVCQRIENIFSRVISRPCVVTIKLVVSKNDRMFARTYLRSEELSTRDYGGYSDYEIGSGKNTALDFAVLPNPTGKPHHYFSANLRMERDFVCERQSYMHFYRSTLVVPIHTSLRHSDTLARETDLVGFLCVDTMSVNRLNDGYHVYMLAALASQMYDFMSIMRGKYLKTH